MKYKKTPKLLNLNLTSNQMLVLNMASSVLSLLVTLGISFFVTPYIVKNLGAEANGYTTLANNFISYATILKVAMNSMGSRFITISYIKGEKDKAKKYYSALFYGDLFLSIALSFVAVLLVWKLEYVINISNKLVMDVKILFALLFFNFIFNTITSVWLTATFLTNKIYLDKIRELQGTFLRLLITAGLFILFRPRIFYVAFATVVAAFLQNAYSMYYKIHLTPDLKANRKDFSFSYVKTILSAGIWNAFSASGELLFSGMDLLITNLLISGEEMGVLSISKTMPGVISSLNAAIQGVFTPSLVGEYARGGSEAIAKSVYKYAKVVMIVCTIPVCFLIVYGGDFYALWQPTQDAKRLQMLSALACSSIAVTSCAMSVYNVFTVVNKVKQLSVATIITGLASVSVTYLLVKYTDLGIVAVAGVSSLMYVLRSLLWGLPMSAKYLNMKWTKFYPLVGYNLLLVLCVCLVGTGIRFIVPHSSWITLIFSAVIFCFVALVINIFIVLRKNERRALITKLLGKLKK